MDLTAVHDILLKTGYKDDEGAENEVTDWNNDESDLCYPFVMKFPHFLDHIVFVSSLLKDILFIKVYLFKLF